MKKVYIKDIQNIELQILKEIKEIFSKENIPFYLRAGSLLGCIRHKGFIPWDTDVDVEIPIINYEKAILLLEQELSKHFQVYRNNRSKEYGQLFARVGLTGFNDGVIHIDLFPMVGMIDEPKKQEKYFKQLNRLMFYFNLKKKIFSDLLISRKKIKIPFKILLWHLLKLIPSKYFIKNSEKLVYKYDYEKCDYVVNPFSKYRQKSIFPKQYYVSTLYKKFENIDMPIPFEYEKILIQLYNDYQILKNEYKINEKFCLEVNRSLYDQLLKIINKEGNGNEKI